jgi:hypothetical protein
MGNHGGITDLSGGAARGLVSLREGEQDEQRLGTTVEGSHLTPPHLSFFSCAMEPMSYRTRDA